MATVMPGKKDPMLLPVTPPPLPKMSFLGRLDFAGYLPAWTPRSLFDSTSTFLKAHISIIPGYEFSRPPMLSPPSDTSSPVYPERPIRPLPKRRLRSRLSNEQADSIVYPPVPPSSSPFLGMSQNLNERGTDSTTFSSDLHDTSYGGVVNVHEEGCDCPDQSDVDSDEEENHYGHRYSWPGKMMRYPPNSRFRSADRPRVPPPHSSTSSADGYESFENTNNKKKRKIPISGAMVPAGVGMASQSVDISVQDDTATRGQYYASGTGVGISGAGRGRFSSRAGNRQSLERKPLTASTNAVNAYATGLDGTSSEPGIISAAIANAAGKGVASPPKGQENISLLQRQNQGPDQTKDFTFECKSNSSNKMVSATRSPNTALGPRPPNTNAPGGQAVANHGTQTGLRGGGQQHSTPLGPDANQTPQNPQPPSPEKRRPRRPGAALERAARQRKRQQAADNFYHPPKPGEKLWVCEFCEYEMIFGVPPKALVRQYEIKDRRERKRQAEQRRLLDKAKAKGRKNRKSKNNNKNTGSTAAATNAPQDQAYDPQYDDEVGQDVDSQGEEFFDDGYDENAPMPSPFPDRHSNTVNGDYLRNEQFDASGQRPPPRLS